MRAFCLAALMLVSAASAQDMESLGVEFLSGRTMASATWYWGTDSGGLRTAPINAGVTRADAQAVTNTEAFLSWLAERELAAHAPAEFKDGIALPSLTNGWFYTLIMADDGTPLPVLYRQSPVKWAEYESRKAEALAKHLAARKLKAAYDNSVGGITNQLAQLRVLANTGKSADTAACINGLLDLLGVTAAGDIADAKEKDKIK